VDNWRVRIYREPSYERVTNLQRIEAESRFRAPRIRTVAIRNSFRRIAGSYREKRSFECLAVGLRRMPSLRTHATIGYAQHTTS